MYHFLPPQVHCAPWFHPQRSYIIHFISPQVHWAPWFHPQRSQFSSHLKSTRNFSPILSGLNLLDVDLLRDLAGLLFNSVLRRRFRLCNVLFGLELVLKRLLMLLMQIPVLLAVGTLENEKNNWL